VAFLPLDAFFEADGLDVPDAFGFRLFKILAPVVGIAAGQQIADLFADPVNIAFFLLGLVVLDVFPPAVLVIAPVDDGRGGGGVGLVLAGSKESL